MRWDYSKITEPTPYWGDETYKRAIRFLDGPGTLEDWGCGTCYAKQFVKESEYVGVDISPSRFNNITTSLVAYKSNVDYILLRHVLEHNYQWWQILYNALQSAQKKLCVVLFTPFTKIWPHEEIAFHTEIGVPDLRLNEVSFKDLLENNPYTVETYGPETIFYITKI